MAQEAAGSVVVDIGGNLAPFEAKLAAARRLADAFDAEVSKKLSGASSADAGIAKIAAAVDKTNALLAKLTGTATPAGVAVSKLSAESTKASTAIASVGTSSATASASVGKLATETSNAAASIQRAVTANGAFAASNLQMANGSAARNADIQAYGAALDDIRAKYNPLFRVTREYLVLKEELRLATRLGAISEDEAASALGRSRASTLASIAVLKAHGGATRLASYEVRNLQYQLIDIAQSIPLAFQSPLYFMQNLGFQFAQIGQIFMGKGGLRAGLAETGTVIGSVASRLGSFVAGSAILRGLGTAATVAALGFETIRDRASEAEHRAVGFGETISAVFQTIGNDIRTSAVGGVFDEIVTGAKYAFQKLGSAAVDIAELVINSFHAAFHDIVADWQTFPDQLGAFFVGAANNGIAAINTLVKAVSDSVDKISAALNNIPGVNIPLLNAPDQAIAPLDNKYLDNLKKAVADRNAAIEQIMKSTPLRTFASDVVDQIQTNHALEDLKSLKNISFDSGTGSANGFSSAIGGIGKAANGVTVEFGGMSQQIINVSRLFQDAKLAQLGELQQTVTNLHSTQAEIKKLQDDLKASSHATIADVFGEGFFGNASAARDAIDRTVTSIDKLFNAYDHGNGTVKTVNDSLELLRQTLLAQGGDPVAINAFFDSIVSGEIHVRQLRSTVQGLHEDITSIPNKTVTITVVTKQIGSGTQSQYSVPNQTGGYSGVGVTRYGGVAGQQSGPSMSAYSVPSTGYGSQGGYGGGGTSTVGVTRFSSEGPWESPYGATANEWSKLTPQNKEDIYNGKTDYSHILYPDYYRASGGPISPGSPYWVGEKGPELVVPTGAATVIPNGQSMALASAQSGFTGREATKESERYWTVLMNIEANTRKTAQLLDDINTASRSSGLGGGSSSSGYSGSGQGGEGFSAYLSALGAARANYSAIGGGGLVGYGSNLLAASPEQIAYNVAYGGMSSLGSPGANDYEGTLAQTQVAKAQSEARRYQAIHGFATGGIDSSDTQKVEFFKNPNEKVIIATPQQFADVRQSATGGGSVDNRPIQFSQTNHWNGNTPPSQDSLAAVRRATALGFQDAERAKYGR